MVFACTLFSSSKGNCTYVRSGRDEFLIDAGVSAKRICDSLCGIGADIKNISAIFITHEHIDHIKGLAVISKKYGIPVYAPYLCARYIKTSFPEVAPYLCENNPGNTVKLQDTVITAYATPHDSQGSVCFRITTPSGVIGYATDIGHASEQVWEALCGADSVVVESNHDLELLENGPYPRALKNRILSDYGHLSNCDCGSLLCRLVHSGTKRIVLAHLSEENNRPPLALAAARGTLMGSGIRVGEEVILRVAPPDGVCEIMNIKE